MRNPVHALLLLFDAARLAEPVRLWLYTVAGVAIAGLSLFGYVNDATAEYFLSIAGLILGVTVPAAELVRGAVFSPKTHYAATGAELVDARHREALTLTINVDTTASDAAMADALAALPTDTQVMHRVPPVPAR